MNKELIKLVSRRLKFPYSGCSWKDRLRLYIYATVRTINFPRIGPVVTTLERVLVCNVKVSIRGLTYSLLDSGSWLVLQPGYEPFIWPILAENIEEGNVFVDVGAHIGLYTCWAARKVGERGCVIAVEPNPWVFRKLVENVKLNNLKNVKLFNVAAWDSPRILKLFLSDVSGRDSALVRKDKHITVKALPLDDIIEGSGVNRVDLIKIDVEGAEHYVLKGAMKLLMRFKPNIIIEVSPGNLLSVRNILGKAGYFVQQLYGFNFLAKPRGS